MLKELQLRVLRHKVMEFLWEHGSATADIIRASLAHEHPLTDSTVRTILRRLETKNTCSTLWEVAGMYFPLGTSRENWRPRQYLK